MPSDQDRPGDADLDAAFAEIIAGWDDPSDDSVPRWPVAEDKDGPDEDQDETAAHDVVEPPGRSPTEDAPTDPSGDDGPPVGSGQAPELGPRDWEPAAVEEHYLPPEPPPLPRGDLPTRLAWGGVLLGPVFLLLAGLFWRDVGRLWIVGAASAFVGGFIALVARLPTSSEDDDNDGAVV